MALAHEPSPMIARAHERDDDSWRERPLKTDRDLRQARQLLQAAFVVAPIVAGLDKFFNALVDWGQYLSAPIYSIVGGFERPFMMAVGIVEIAAGIGVAVKPGLFAYVVAAWLGGIILNLLMAQGYYDIALRDFGLLLGALALARLSAREAHHRAA